MTRTEALLVWLSAILVGASGVALGVMKYLMRPADPFAAVNHPLQPATLHAHVLTAPALVFALGMIAASHVAARLRARQPTGRRTGIGTAAAVLPMVVSGYAIQVITDPAVLRAAVVIHVASGVLFLGAIGAHLTMTWSRARSIAAQRAMRDVTVERATSV